MNDNKSLKSKLLKTIMLLNKLPKTDIHKRKSDYLFEDLEYIKKLCDNERYERILELNYGSSLEYICNTIINNGWTNLTESVQNELYAFQKEIFNAINLKIKEYELLENEDILETITIYRHMLKQDGRL